MTSKANQRVASKGQAVRTDLPGHGVGDDLNGGIQVMIATGWHLGDVQHTMDLPSHGFGDDLTGK